MVVGMKMLLEGKVWQDGSRQCTHAGQAKFVCV